MQNRLVGQDTQRTSGLGEVSKTVERQIVPVNRNAYPSVLTAIQKVSVGQETDESSPLAESICRGPCQRLRK